MTVKKTEYTKKELISLAGQQEFGSGFLVFGDEYCALGWLLSLSGVHKSRMSGMRVTHDVDEDGSEYTDLEDVLRINCAVSKNIYTRNDGATRQYRSKAVMDVLEYCLPHNYILTECDKEFRAELIDDS